MSKRRITLEAYLDQEFYIDKEDLDKEFNGSFRDYLNYSLEHGDFSILDLGEIKVKSVSIPIYSEDEIFNKIDLNEFKITKIVDNDVVHFKYRNSYFFIHKSSEADGFLSFYKKLGGRKNKQLNTSYRHMPMIYHKHGQTLKDFDKKKFIKDLVKDVFGKLFWEILNKETKERGKNETN